MEEEELMLDLRENRIDIALLYLPNNKDMSAYESTALREDEFVYYAPNIIDNMEVASLKAIQQQPLLMYPPKYFMYRTLKNYVGNGQQNLHIRGSRLSNPYTMIDYCQKINQAAS